MAIRTYAESEKVNAWLLPYHTYNYEKWVHWIGPTHATCLGDDKFPFLTTLPADKTDLLLPLTSVRRKRPGLVTNSGSDIVSVH